MVYSDRVFIDQLNYIQIRKINNNQKRRILFMMNPDDLNNRRNKTESQVTKR